MSFPPGEEAIVHELFERAFAAGLSVLGDTKLWMHVEYRGNRYYLEWWSGGKRRQIRSPIGDETEWELYEQPRGEWTKVEGDA